MMFDFLWHLRGSVKLGGGTSNAAVLDAIEDLLDRQRKPITERSDDRVAFDDPLWQNLGGPNWLAMILYDRGGIWIEQGMEGRRLRYDLRSLHGFIFCLCGPASILGFLALSGAGALKMLCFSALMFCWLYGMNIGLALLRVPRAIRKAATPQTDFQS